MTASSPFEEALARLRDQLLHAQQDPKYSSFVSARDEVLARYQPIFQLEHISLLTEDEFRSFLFFENNRHWKGLHRMAHRLLTDMNRLKEALRTLLDESQPLADRYDRAMGQVKGLGKALATAILLISQPQRYGVWNTTSETALRYLGLWPDFPRGATDGQKYERINVQLLQLAKDLKIDLWTLDALLWYAQTGKSGDGEGSAPRTVLENLPPPEPQGDLQAVTENFLEALEWSNLRFDPAFVRAFIASLATKPFAILSGLSGSGKADRASTWQLAGQRHARARSTRLDGA